MNLVIAQKEIAELKKQILALKTENQELKQRLFYAEYLAGSPEIKSDMEALQKGISQMRSALVAMKKQNDDYKKQIEDFKQAEQSFAQVAVLPTGKVI